MLLRKFFEKNEASSPGLRNIFHLVEGLFYQVNAQSTRAEIGQYPSTDFRGTAGFSVVPDCDSQAVFHLLETQSKRALRIISIRMSEDICASFVHGQNQQDFFIFVERQILQKFREGLTDDSEGFAAARHTEGGDILSGMSFHFLVRARIVRSSRSAAEPRKRPSAFSR